jgi:hypothetical protein
MTFKRCAFCSQNDWTRHSPNGIDIIWECLSCGLRWLLQPGHEPVRMPWATTNLERR